MDLLPLTRKLGYYQLSDLVNLKTAYWSLVLKCQSLNLA
jgi:hypothetical protein